MAVIPWIRSGEKSVGRGHPTLTDVDNRPLRTMLTTLGLDPDATFAADSLGILTVKPSGTTTGRTLSARFGEWLNVKDFGAVGDGVADDTAAFIAMAAVANSKCCWVPPGTYRVGVVGDLPFGMKLYGGGYGVTTLKKITTGVVFTCKAAGAEFVNLGFDADVATDTAFGTSGAMIDYPGGAFTAAEGRITNCYSANINVVVRFGPDGGSRHQVFGGYWLPYTTTAGSEGKTYQTGVGGDDTGALERMIVGLVTDGQIDISGSYDQKLGEVDCRRVIFTATTTLASISGGIWGSLGQPISVNGSGTRVQGVRMAGNVTLDAAMTGSCVFIGNPQTTGTFTDNTATGVCKTIHDPLSVSYSLLNKSTHTKSVNPEELQSSRVSTNIGNAATTLTLDQSPRTIRFATAITADRDVNLPASARDGYRYRIVRQSAATGAFNVNVKTSGGSTLKALAAASTWCDVEWDGPAGAFILVASGTL